MKNMKKKIVAYLSAFAILTLFAISANAQSAEFGVRFMPTFSSFEIKTSSGGNVKGEATLGFGIGALLGYNFTNNIGIQAEVIYSSSSQKYKEMDLERKINLRYVNIPLLLSLNTGKSNPVNFNIVGGPQIGISVGSKFSTNGGNVDNRLAVLSVKKGDLGLAYGAGIDFGLNAAHTIRLSLGYRGVFGLFDISDNSGTISTDSYYLLDRTHINTHAGYAGLSILF